MTEKKSEYGSDVLVDLLKSMGIEYAALNPGASIRGIHDSIVNYGGNNPELILCCHEGIAVAIASGYYRACGKPMVVLLHDLEGLMHATKAVFDAWMERDAMVLIGGNGPVDIEKRRAGIDWVHTALVPNILVRNYVKWDDQPQGLTSFNEALVRAYRIAMAEPPAPVYLSLDADIQEQKLQGSVTVPTFEKYAPLTIGEGSLQALEKIAGLLVDAENPVIVVDRYGRDDHSVQDLVSLAEELGAPVLDTGLRFNFPSDHPLNLSGHNEEILGNADLVLALDVKDLYHSLVKEAAGHFARLAKYMTKQDCKVFRIDMETVSTNNWVSDYGRLTPTTMTVSAYAPTAVVKLLELCRSKLRSSESGIRAKIEDRKKALSEKSRSARAKWLETALSQNSETPLSLASLALATWELARQHDWVLAYPSYTSGGVNAWIRRLWGITKFHQYPGRGGGTGTGIGRAIGAALANRGRLCIDFQPDGDLLYSVSGLWTAAHLKIPMLIIMLDNRTYFNDEEHQRAMAVDRNRPVENRTIGIRIEDPNVDFKQLAQSYGIKAAGLVEDLSGLKEGLSEGIGTVMKQSRPFLLDVHIQSRKE